MHGRTSIRLLSDFYRDFCFGNLLPCPSLGKTQDISPGPPIIVYAISVLTQFNFEPFCLPPKAKKAVTATIGITTAIRAGRNNVDCATCAELAAKNES